MVFSTAFHYLAIACISLLCIWYVDHRWKRRRWYSCSKSVSGPYALPVIGSAYVFFGEPSNVLKVFLEMIDSYSGIVKFWLGNKLLYFLMEPKYIEKVISNPKAVDKDYFYEEAALAIGDGLVTSSGAKWRRHRKLINPSFNQRTLESFVELFNEKNRELVKTLEKTIGEKDIPLYSIIGRNNVELTCLTAMGVDINDLSTKNKENLCEAFDMIVMLVTEKTLKLWNHLDVVWYLSGKKKMYQDCAKALRSVVEEIIKKKMQDDKLGESKQKTDIVAGGVAARRRAFLDSLMTSSGLDEKEIRDEVTTFISAASETTANTMSAVFAIFGIYPDIQEKVYKEVTDIIGVETEVMPQDLNRMEFTDRVIKETLRLFPAGPITSRHVSEDIDLGDNIILPKGVSVCIPVMYMNKSGEFWEDPLKFDPDRFLPENVAKRHPFTYYGFSHGPRSCIGSKYAMMNMKVMIAHVIRRFKFFSEYKSAAEIELKMSLILKMKDGPKVWIERR